MKTMVSLRRFGILSLSILALALTAQSASAQSVEGKFTLTHEVFWGGTTLPAGDYSFTIDGTNGSDMLALQSGKRTVALIMAASHEEQSAGNSALVIEQGSVRELRVPEAGYSLFYPASKGTHGSMEEERQTATISAPILASGN